MRFVYLNQVYKIFPLGGDGMTCTFFGHRDTPLEIEPLLQAVLINLIEHKNVCQFYVGNHGNFDTLVNKNLKRLKLIYPHIQYVIVLAYPPTSKNLHGQDPSYTIYPEGLENIQGKYAIIQRNIWMIHQADYVVTYVKHIASNAEKFKRIAEKQGKITFNLADYF